MKNSYTKWQQKILKSLACRLAFKDYLLEDSPSNFEILRKELETYVSHLKNQKNN